MIKKLTQEEARARYDALAEMAGEDVIVFENPDYIEALIGFSNDNRAVYDFNLMVEHLMLDGMTEEEAVEFIDYNTLGSLRGDGYPIVVFELPVF